MDGIPKIFSEEEAANYPFPGTIHFAAYHGEIELTKSFMAVKNVHPDTKDDTERSSLIYAAIGNQESCIDFLLDCGADVSRALPVLLAQTTHTHTHTRTIYLLLYARLS
jgi:hypothetical protein